MTSFFPVCMHRKDNFLLAKFKNKSKASNEFSLSLVRVCLYSEINCLSMKLTQKTLFQCFEKSRPKSPAPKSSPSRNSIET